VVATIPGERQETALAVLDRPRWPVTYVEDGKEKTKRVSTHTLLFAGEVDITTRRRKSLFSNTLVLPGFNLYEALKIDDPKKLAWRDHLFDLRAHHLEQAVLYYADLSKADLTGAFLQGASLQPARLQGARLGYAQLQGASLSGAQLQGASFQSAQLQGASLMGAIIRATTFLGAFLWRTNWGDIDSRHLGARRLDTSLERWRPVWKKDEKDSDPVPWDAQAYADLRASMNSIPEGKTREDTLKRIEILDCENPNKASCDPATAPPPEVLNWQKSLLKANIDEAAFQKVLAAQLRDLVCANNANTIYILRGIINAYQLFATNPALVDLIMSKDCPVSAALTDDDKAKLLQIKQIAEKESEPPKASKKKN
jgi:hypothetical protein